MPIKRYYRRELESDDEKKLEVSSSASDSERKEGSADRRYRSQQALSPNANRSPFGESDGRGR